MKSKIAMIPAIAGMLRASLMAAILVFSYTHPVAAQHSAAHDRSRSDSIPAGVPERYPSGPIQSVEDADSALADMQQERARVEAEFADEERACHPKFFVTSCLDAAKEARRQALAQIQKVEVEANAFKRRARVEERDKALADKAPQTGPIIKSQKVKEDRPVEKKSEASRAQSADRPVEPKRAGGNSPDDDRVARHNAKLEKLKAEEAADAEKRAANVAAFEKRARDAEERQREVAARKAERERKRAANNSSTDPGAD